MSARPIMVQGTMSDVGKSLVVAGLCRVLAQDGLSVAPFKSQNMALNSAVTSDGLEIGRAQALQAEAAGIEPTVDMNPVLLKPTSDRGSQVVVRGRALATMPAREYFAYKRSLMPRIQASYQALADAHDVVVIEGAGSPVELNLLANDIVNMGIARMACSPVLLVGDIDRGGIFAQLVGTLMLLEDDERALVKATVVNKFRGDAGLFSSGLEILRERCGIPVAGLIPHLDLHLEDEDSLSVRLDARRGGATVDIAVVRLPRISNFTDFDPLMATDSVGVRYVTRQDELGTPDLVVLPGTKSTLADLAWLRARGLDGALLSAHDAGIPILGICGGYQMLGLEVRDPEGVESGGAARGLGLLPVRTTFAMTKRTRRVRGALGTVGGALRLLSGKAVGGYEIHAGETELLGGEPFVELEDPDGTRRADGCQLGDVYGCYVHGLFEERELTQALIDSLLRRRGLDGVPLAAIDWRTHRNRELDALADAIRTHLDMELVYRVIEEGP